MSESMRMQSELVADLEVYRAKGELIALRAENATLQQLLEDVLHTFGYLRFHRVAGMDGLLYETHNKMSPERTVEACEKRIRATQTAQDAPLTDEQRDIRDCCEKPHDCKWGGLGGCGYEGRNNERANAAQIEGGA